MAPTPAGAPPGVAAAVAASRRPRPWKRVAEGRAVELGVEALLIALVAALVLMPLGMLLWGSFRDAPPGEPGAYTLRNFARVYGDAHFYGVLLNTLAMGVGATLIACAVGVPLAWLIARTDMPFRRTAEFFAIAPFFVSAFIGAIAWSGLAAPEVGLLNRLARWLSPSLGLNVYSLGGMAWVIGLYLSPYVYLFTSGALRSMDATLEEASAISGAGRLYTLRRITLPLVAPSLLGSLLLVFVISIEIFGVPGVLGMPAKISVLSTQIFIYLSFMNPDYGAATVLAFCLLAITALGLYAQRALLARRRFVTVSGRGFRPKRVELGGWRHVAFAGCALYFAVAIVLPYLVLIVASFQSFWTTELTAFTLNNYRAILQHPLIWRALWNSLLLSVGGATLCVAFTTVVAYVVQRTRLPGRALLDQLATVPLGVPGLVMGVALLWTWISVPVGIYGTIWILLIGYITRFMPYGVRAVAASLQQVDEELEECSRTSGGSWFYTLRRVLLPLVKPGVASAWILLFIIFLRELNTSILLYAYGTEVLPVIIFDLFVEGAYPELSALSIVLMAITAAGIFLFRRLLKAEVVPRV